MTAKIAFQLEDAAFGTKEHFLRQGWARNAVIRITNEGAEQLIFGHHHFAHHVRCDKAIHGIGHGHHRHRADLVGDRCEVGGLLWVGAEQDRVARRQQSIDIIMACHHIERMAGDRSGSHLHDKTTDFLADGHVMRLKPVKHALRGGSVGNILSAG